GDPDAGGDAALFAVLLDALDLALVVGGYNRVLDQGIRVDDVQGRYSHALGNELTKGCEGQRQGNGRVFATAPGNYRVPAYQHLSLDGGDCDGHLLVEGALDSYHRRRQLDRLEEGDLSVGDKLLTHGEAPWLL